MAFTPLAEFSTYLQIIRPLDNELDDGGLSAQLDKLSFDAPGIAETISVDADEHMLDEENDTVWCPLISTPAYYYMAHGCI
jgi:ubiquitin-like-conjugating enzyme ATG10